MSDVLKLLLKRLLISLPFFVISAILLIPLSTKSLWAAFTLIPPAFILVEPLSLLVSNPVGSIFNPKSVSWEINLGFSMVEARIMDGMYEEALDLLKKMIPRDPERLDIYMRIMSLAVNDMKQPEIAKDAFHTGIKNLKNLRKRKILAFEYRELMALCRDTHVNENDTNTAPSC
ncbi:MAG: hypothetical protein K8S24_09890 [Candidatus Aegiribacteria sp.]|nr:hypothetical protein [Candidatus Aegiribacteria sp.]